MDELGQPAPGLFQRDLGADDPFAALIHETRFRKAVNATTNGGAGTGRVEADGGDHAGGEDGNGLAHAFSVSNSSVSNSSSSEASTRRSSTSSLSDGYQVLPNWRARYQARGIRP